MISKIGYTDNYGGLISAVEARHLSQKGQEDSRLKRLDDIAHLIKLATSVGSTSVELDITPDEAKVLCTLGYSVTYQIASRVEISWLEETQHSQSSEKSETENEDISSSCEI